MGQPPPHRPVVGSQVWQFGHTFGWQKGVLPPAETQISQAVQPPPHTPVVGLQVWQPVQPPLHCPVAGSQVWQFGQTLGAQVPF